MSYSPIDDTGADKFGNLVSIETFSALANNLNALLDSMPIGSKVPILVGLAGVPTPDPTIWRLCEGGVVTDPNAKLHDQTLPDDRGSFPKGSTTIGQSGVKAGTSTASWSHNHGGNTGDWDMGDDNSDTDDDYITVHKLHHHPISSDLTTPVNVEPAHIRVKFYIKIR